jgi:hypothetical protein
MRPMNPKNPLLQKCLEHLENLPNIKVDFQEAAHIFNHESIAGLLRISSSVNSVDYICKILPSITEVETVTFTFEQRPHNENKLYKQLLLTPYLTDSKIEYFLKQNIEFIDTKGNIYLNSLAAYVFIRAQSDSKKNNLYPFQITSTTLKIIYILLKSPRILEAPLEEIAIASGVALENISNNLKNLYYLGYLEKKRNNRYWIANYTKLLERWKIGYVECMRPELLLGTFTLQEKGKFSELAKNITELASDSDFLIGGELGAAIATNYLYPQSAVIHVSGNHDSIVNKLNLIPSPHGEVIFLQQFGTQNALSNNQAEKIADPLLIHAELIKENNDRLTSTAERLFDKYIEDRRKNA